MKQTENNSCETELYEKSWDWFGEIILANDTERISSQLDDEKTEAEAAAFFQRYDTACRSRIERFFRKEKWKSLLTDTIPRFIRMLVIVAGVLTIAAGIAAASSPAVRTFLAQLIVESTPEYTILQVRPETVPEMEIPEEWTGRYYPGKIPEGLIVDQIFSDSPVYKDISFCDPDSGKIRFSFTEMTNGTVNIDTEDASVQDVTIQGNAGTAIEKNGSVDIYWFDGETFFIVLIEDSTVSDAISYAEGVRKIRE